MEIQGIQRSELQQAAQEIRGMEKQEPVADAIFAADSTAPESPKAPVYDEYVPEDEENNQSIGLYEIIHDEDGLKIRYDNPEKLKDDTDPVGDGSKADASKAEAPRKSKPEKKAESCTTDTDKVDREIKKIKEDAKKLKQQIRSSSDPQKAEELKKQLSKVENELRQKDNDTYRRQHASVS